MAMQDDAAAAYTDLQAGPHSEAARQAGRTGNTSYSPHQLLTGGGVPSGATYVDPSAVHGPTPGVAPPGPSVEHFPIGESDAHAGTYTLGRDDA
jgi:hypothetical protein